MSPNRLQLRFVLLLIAIGVTAGGCTQVRQVSEEEAQLQGNPLLPPPPETGAQGADLSVPGMDDSWQAAVYSRRVETFTNDPRWIGVNNRRMLFERGCNSVRQAYGYVGNGGTEIGGTFSRSIVPGYYGDALGGSVGLDDRLFAAGTFRLHAVDGGSFHLGWFNSRMQGWRPVNQLGWRLDGRSSGVGNARIDYMTQTWNAGGKDTAIDIWPDASTHTFTLEYDPDANSGLGRMIFTIDGGAEQILDLEPGHRALGASMDRFGIFHNQRQSSEIIEIYFDNLTYTAAGGLQRFNDFSMDPGWDARGNRAIFEDCAQRSNNTFGWSTTNYAGPGRGELGGLIWRTEEGIDARVYYADEVGPFTLDDYLEASGMVSFVRGSVDSGALIGFFDQDTNVGQVNRGSFVGVAIEGPSSIGHYFAGFWAFGPDRYCGGGCSAGPVIRSDGRRLPWRMVYNPHAFEGRGGIGVNLDGRFKAYPLEAGLRQRGGTFNRFGMMAPRAGGNSMRIYFDDLEYTKSRGVGGQVRQWAPRTMEPSSSFEHFISLGQWVPHRRGEWD